MNQTVQELNASVYEQDASEQTGQPSAQLEGPPPPPVQEQPPPTKSPGRVAAGKKGGEVTRRRSLIIKKLMIYYKCDYFTAQGRYHQIKNTEELQKILDDVEEGAISDIPVCSKCSHDMVKRSGKYGLFWSCVNYPECRGTRPIKSEIERVTNEQKELSNKKLNLTLEFIDNIGGLDDARRWLTIASQSLGE